MKRIAIYIVLIALTVVAPVNRVDVGHLQPVEVIAISQDGNKIILRTDTGDMGRGDNVEQALTDMKETSAHIIYLDTAEYLLIEKTVKQKAEPIRKYLKGSVKVCLTENITNYQGIGVYLESHGNFPRLKRWSANQNTPILKAEKISKKTEIWY